MMWFCGGHGTCRTTPRCRRRYFEAAVLRWLDTLREGRRPRPPPAPRFEWIDQHGDWHAGLRLPARGRGQRSPPTGSGTLQLVAGDAGSSGTATSATPSASGIDIPIPRPDSRRKPGRRAHARARLPRAGHDAPGARLRADRRRGPRHRDRRPGDADPARARLPGAHAEREPRAGRLRAVAVVEPAARDHPGDATSTATSARTAGSSSTRVALTLPLGKDPGGGTAAPPPPGRVHADVPPQVGQAPRRRPRAAPPARALRRRATAASA